MFNYITISTLLFSLALASPIKRANNQLIVSSRDQKCLSPAGGAAAVTANQIGNGTPLITMDCAQAAGWDISPGSGSVILTGTNYAMDAGSSPGNNGQLKVRLTEQFDAGDGKKLMIRLGPLTRASLLRLGT
jgi:hypothetical protein